ncbi:NAD(P)-binding protein [Altererythrobacter soli]|uniref:NAD(P)-binding protein n=1 Tax=Croceibacterium soli TaxID=1739690 RepID=A0A6I4USX7_9SPHN|nr:FAD-dependent oxidoreductase [Croceibacterium soli]MXP40703.1 NAD(P)-binding protein [Croceibacterium soli]
MERFDVLIVGGGHGGAQAAIALRQQGFAGSVAIVSRDANAPYERPPLSKEYLAGSKPFERLHVRPVAFWTENGIALRLGETVNEVDAQGRRVVLQSGQEIGYGKLIWAAGADPRRLDCPGAELAGIWSVRDRADVDGIRAGLGSGARRVVVVGGGYIGLEAAAVLRQLGCSVVVLEMQDRLLSRVAGPTVARFVLDEHRGQGVDVRLGARLQGFEGTSGRVAGVRLEDGTLLPAELVIVGIGVVPAVAPLNGAGGDGSHGVAVDEFCRTGLPDVYAVGDCAAHRNPYARGATIRLESVQNARDMAAVAVRHIRDDPVPYDVPPWFWSNQYDIRMQSVGLLSGFEEEVVSGAPAERKFSVRYLADGRLIAADCINDAKALAQARAELLRCI